MITDPALDKLAPNTQGAIRDTYLKCLNDRTMDRYIMWASMNDEFSQKFEEAQPEEMLQVLRDSFGTPDDVERYKTSYVIFNARMMEGVSITDHVLYMIEQIKKLNKLHFPLHE